MCRLGEAGPLTDGVGHRPRRRGETVQQRGARPANHRLDHHSAVAPAVTSPRERPHHRPRATRGSSPCVRTPLPESQP